MTQQGLLIVVSGPSGAGKGTICQELLRSFPNIFYSVSATTRSPRQGEVDGVNYWFVSHDKFRMMLANGELLESAEVYGNYYGTPRRKVLDMLDEGKDVLLEIDIQGALQVKENYPQGVFVYVMPPSLKELAKRIINRGTDTEAVIEQRLHCAKDEIEFAAKYQYIIVNDDVSEAVKQLQAIIVSEKCRVTRNKVLIDHICHYGCIE